MNPVPLMTLVEVIRCLATSDETTAMINEAIFALQEGRGTPEAIDTVMKPGMNHPMGRLTLCDCVGLDVVLHVVEVLQRDLGDDQYRPALLLRRMVDAGYLGHKSRRGLYQYKG